MRVSPLTSAIIYFAMGAVFIYAAIQTADETIWNFTTILLAVVATMDFGVAIRMVNIHLQIKKKNKKD
ncbi:YdiK family protein [Virgibacillus xinjiangensis]|uniref:YdiK family protein n=1 Tax=Virgibacillus xinjiangensis TaxID=393090 RepID=A0ABV7CZ11_9BACI